MELLRELGPFHYMMNQGNVGYALIAASTVALFEREELNFSSCGPELPAGKEEITLVYGGGEVLSPILACCLIMYAFFRIRASGSA